MNSSRKTATNWLSAIGYRLSAIGYRLALGIWLSLLISNHALAVDWDKEKTVIEGCTFAQTFAGETSGVCGYGTRKMGMKTEAHISAIALGEPNAAGSTFRIRCIDESSCIKTSFYDSDNGALLCTTSHTNDIIGVNKNDYFKFKKQAKNLENSCAAEQRRQDGQEKQQRQSANQARQMCEAQKQTCLASCPAWRSGINNDTHFSCNSRCNGISCY